MKIKFLFSFGGQILLLWFNTEFLNKLTDLIISWLRNTSLLRLNTKTLCLLLRNWFLGINAFDTEIGLALLVTTMVKLNLILKNMIAFWMNDWSATITCNIYRLHCSCQVAIFYHQMHVRTSREPVNTERVNFFNFSFLSLLDTFFWLCQNVWNLLSQVIWALVDLSWFKLSLIFDLNSISACFT